jgi:histidine triad (HIT) family protein
MEDCIFCKIANGEIMPQIVWQDDSHIAFLDQNPIKPGHTLVIPKRHNDYVFDLDNGEYSKLFLAVKEVANRIKLKLNPKRVGVLVEGFGVPHAHVHLVPIDHGYELNPANAKTASAEELEKVIKIINA